MYQLPSSASAAKQLSKETEALLKEIEKYSDFPMHVLSERLFVRERSHQLVPLAKDEDVTAVTLARCITELAYVLQNIILYGAKLGKLDMKKLKESENERSESKMFLVYSLSPDPPKASRSNSKLCKLFNEVWNAYFAERVQRVSKVPQKLESSKRYVHFIQKFKQVLPKLSQNNPSDREFTQRLEGTQMFLNCSKLLEICNYSLLNVMNKMDQSKRKPNKESNSDHNNESNESKKRLDPILNLTYLDELKLRWLVESRQNYEACGEQLKLQLEAKFSLPKGCSAEEANHYFIDTRSESKKQPNKTAITEQQRYKKLQENLLVMFTRLGFRPLKLGEGTPYQCFVNDAKVSLGMQREYQIHEFKPEEFKFILKINTVENWMILDILTNLELKECESPDSITFNSTFINQRFNFKFTFLVVNLPDSPQKLLTLKQYSRLNTSVPWINRVVHLMEIGMLAYRVLKQDLMMEHTDLQRFEQLVDHSSRYIEHYTAYFQSIYNRIFTVSTFE